MKKRNLDIASLVIEVLILLVLVWNIYPAKSVEAQLAASSGFSYAHISTATNTLIKSANGTLHTLTINTTAAGAVTIFDANTANCTGGTAVAIIPATAVVGSYHYDIQFLTGLCVTTAAASDVTVASR